MCDIYATLTRFNIDCVIFATVVIMQQYVV